MKAPTIAILAASLLAASGLAVRAQQPEEVRAALRLAGADIQSALAASTLPKDKPLAILPVRGDSNGYILGILKTAITGAGLLCVEGKGDPFFDEVLKEVAWDERKEDMLDTNTIVKFGQLKAAKLLAYAFIREAWGGQGCGFVELELHVSSIETKQHLWSGNFSRRFYDPQLPIGPIDLHPEVRRILREAFQRLPAQLRAAPKLRDVHSILIVPLAGDIDRFMTGLVESSLSGTQFLPKELDVRTLGEGRALLRDDPKAADAILYGAVRDLSSRKKGEYPDRTEYDVSAAVQMTIQASPSGDVLWSYPLEARGTLVERLSWWEMVKKYGPFVLARKAVVVVPLIVLVGLVVLAMFFRAMRRAR
jgi:hypothetical protein